MRALAPTGVGSHVPSLVAENALVSATARVLGGDGDTVGNVTSGGSGSALLALKAARDGRPDVVAPRLLVPASAHAAFARAAAYLRVALDAVPVSPESLRPSPSDIGAALCPQTVLVAVSAPSYPHGVVDPVAEVAALARDRGVRCHVDACSGGFLLPYLRRLGVAVPEFDLAVPGVTSISVDVCADRYAYPPEGVSVLLHRDADLRRPQYVAWADWPGYPMVDPGMSSTRPGGPVAAAYAALRRLGDAGCLSLARRTLAAARGLAAEVSTMEALRMVGNPDCGTVCFTSVDTTVDLFVLAEELAARGWHTRPQPHHGEIPSSLHLAVTASLASRVPVFGAALADSVAAARRRGPAPVPPELLALRPEEVTPRLVAQLAAAMDLGNGLGGGATLNAILDRAPARLRERLLVELVSLVQRPDPRPP